MHRFAAGVSLSFLAGLCGLSSLFGGGEEEPAASSTPEPAAGSTVAQGAPWAAPAGAVALAAGFTPDPRVLEGNAGGPTAASTLAPSCTGWVPAAPSHVVSAGAAFAALRFVVNAGDADTTLAVRGPSGTVECADDSDGLNPIVELRGAAAGTYEIFVGSYHQGESHPYRLGVSTLSTVGAAQVGAPGGAPAGVVAAPVPASTAEALALAEGFAPDPQVLAGSSGGPAQASSMRAGCTGWLPSAPSHAVTAQASFPLLRFVVNAGEGDTTLAVRTPSGSTECGDDNDGLNPIVEVSGAAPGVYSIWVGSYHDGASHAYRLGVTARAEVMAAEVGAPEAWAAPTVTTGAAPADPAAVAQAGEGGESGLEICLRCWRSSGPICTRCSREHPRCQSCIFNNDGNARACRAACGAGGTDSTGSGAPPSGASPSLGRYRSALDACETCLGSSGPPCDVCDRFPRCRDCVQDAEAGGGDTSSCRRVCGSSGGGGAAPAAPAPSRGGSMFRACEICNFEGMAGQSHCARCTNRACNDCMADAYENTGDSSACASACR